MSLALRPQFLLLFLVLVSLPSFATADAQVDALMAFSGACGGSAWTSAVGWNASASSPCGSSGFFGVTCDENGVVSRVEMSGNNVRCALDDAAPLALLTELVALDLSENRLTGTLPSWLFTLSKLEDLNLGFRFLAPILMHRVFFSEAVADNEITGTIPSEIGQLRNLKRLNLNRQKLESPLPSTMRQLTKLQSLELSRNQFSEPTPDWLGDLVSLQLIDMGFCDMYPITTALGRCLDLEYIDFRNNPLRGTTFDDMNWMANLSKLKVIEFSGSNLGGTIPQWITSLTTITDFALNDNSAIYGTLPDGLGRWTELLIFTTTGAQITGTIPPEIGAWKKCWILSFFNNRLTGTLPESLGGMTSMYQMYITRNDLTGTIPESFANLTALNRFWAPGNSFTGAFPKAFYGMQGLNSLDISGSKLTGELQAFQSPVLTELLMSGNQLHGKVDPLCSSPSLVKANFDGNKLSGTVPMCLNVSMAALQSLSLNNNELVGTVPLSISTLPNLEVLGLGGNKIVEFLGIPKMTKLTHLNLSNNLINVAGQILISRFKFLPNLISLDLSSNQMFGGLDTPVFWDPVVQPFARIQKFGFSKNQLAGPINPLVCSSDSLRVLDFSDNEITGAIPEGCEHLDTIRISGNSDMVWAFDKLPSYLKFTSQMVLDASQRFLCPKITGVSKEVLVDLDYSYYNGSMCVCDRGYTGSNAICVPVEVNCPPGTFRFDSVKGINVSDPRDPLIACLECPANATCHGGRDPPLANDGFWFSSEKETLMLNCNGGLCHGGPAETCALYSGGFMCAECLPGYFKTDNNRSCSKCTSTNYGLFVLVILVVLVFCTGVYVVQSNRAVEITSIGDISTNFVLLVNFLQVVNLYATISIDMPPFIVNLLQFFSFTNLQLDLSGLACVFGDVTWLQQHSTKLMIPTVFMAIFSSAFLLNCCRVFLLRAIGCTKEPPVSPASLFAMPRFALDCLLYPSTNTELILSLKRFCNCIIFILLIGYVSVSMLSLRFWVELDQNDGTVTMFDYPSVEMYSEQWQAYVGSSIYAIVVYTVGLVIGSIIFFIVLHRSNNNKDVLQWGITLTARYQPKYFWWELVLLVRKLAVAIIVAEFSSSPNTMLACLIFILLIALSLQLSFRPFIHDNSNHLEPFLLQCNIGVLCCILALAGRPTRSLKTAMEVCVGILVVIALVAVVVTMYLSLRGWYRKSFGAKSKVQKPEDGAEEPTDATHPPKPHRLSVHDRRLSAEGFQPLPSTPVEKTEAGMVVSDEGGIELVVMPGSTPRS